MFCTGPAVPPSAPGWCWGRFWKKIGVLCRQLQCTGLRPRAAGERAGVPQLGASSPQHRAAAEGSLVQAKASDHGDSACGGRSLPRAHISPGCNLPKQHTDVGSARKGGPRRAALQCQPHSATSWLCDLRQLSSVTMEERRSRLCHGRCSESQQQRHRGEARPPMYGRQSSIYEAPLGPHHPQRRAGVPLRCPRSRPGCRLA